MQWRFEKAREAFGRYCEHWDAINRSCRDHILLDSIFVGALIRHFATDETLLAIANDDNAPGMVLVEKARPGLWQTFQPAQGPIGLVLLSDTADSRQRIFELIRSLPGYSFGFSVLQQDPDFTVFSQSDTSNLIERTDYMETSRLQISGDFDAYWKGTGRYFVDDLRRQTRRLAEQGIEVEFVIERRRDAVAECIEDYSRLETTGWKGKEGTAVAASNAQGRFYREVMEEFCDRGEGVIFRLLFNDKVVASDLILERNGMSVVLKIAYDENFPGISPGKFMHREILRHLYSDGKTKSLEWYGRVHDWQRKLGSVPRAMFHLNVYRHGWVPLARKWIKSTRGIMGSGNEE
jgi:hypothetical protein